MARLRAMTWRFDMVIELPALSDREEVRVVTKSILDEAQSKTAILHLDQSSFSYDVPEEGRLARISGYLHARDPIWQTTVKTWICDARISELEWTAILPGQHAHWKQHESIREILSACTGGSRCLEDWKGLSTALVSKGGRPRKTPAPTDRADSAAAAVGAAATRSRGRPPRPQPVESDSAGQAAVRARLHRFEQREITELCAVMGLQIPKRAPKSEKVALLMTKCEELQLAWQISAPDGADAAAAGPRLAAASTVESPQSVLPGDHICCDNSSPKHVRGRKVFVFERSYSQLARRGIPT